MKNPTKLQQLLTKADAAAANKNRTASANENKNHQNVTVAQKPAANTTTHLAILD